MKLPHLVLAGFLVVLAAPTSRADDPPKTDDAKKGGRFALLVGVKQYDPTELRNLQFAEDDVTTLSKGDEKASDGVWSTNTFGAVRPDNVAPGKYQVRIIAHDKTTFRGFEKAAAVVVDVDGVEIK